MRCYAAPCFGSRRCGHKLPPIALLRGRLETDGAEASALDRIEQDVRDELDAMRERGLAAPFPSAQTVPEFAE